MENCLECGCTLSIGVSKYSYELFGIPLCREHQDWVKKLEPSVTGEAIRLYFALRQRGVPAELEKWDGYKHIDIAIVEAKVNIEVDGVHHNLDTAQALADLKRTYHSFLKGYLTLRIPNALVRTDYHLEETADYIVGFLIENRNRDNKLNKNF